MGLPSGTFQESYAQDMAIFSTRLHWLMLIALLSLVFTVPFFVSDRVLSFLIIVGISIVSVLGLNVMTGLCHQISLGHAAFMMVGAYTSGILCVKLGWPFWAALPCAGLGAGLVGVIFGSSSLRLKGFELIIATIAAQFIIPWIIIQMRTLTGGADGLTVPYPEIGGIKLSSDQSYYYLVMIIACIGTFFFKNLARTRAGRAWIAIRDNETAAQVMGVNPWNYKILAFFIGCSYAGVAGSLLAHRVGFVSVEQFPFFDSLIYLAMLIIGGMGSTVGAIFGAFFLRALGELVITIAPIIGSVFPFLAGQAAASLGLMTHGLVFILFLIFEPRGLAHRWQIIKIHYRLWPFSY